VEDILKGAEPNIIYTVLTPIGLLKASDLAFSVHTIFSTHSGLQDQYSLHCAPYYPWFTPGIWFQSSLSLYLYQLSHTWYASSMKIQA
jgi:hypothetical protein